MTESKTNSAPVHQVQSLKRSLERRLDSRKTSLLGSGTVKESIKEIERNSQPGKHLKRAGIALLLSPDPFTDVAAVPLLAAGALLDRKASGIGMKDLLKKARELQKDLSELRI